jgi:hypothetical protein
MTKSKKIECLTKLLTWYEDAYAHCEGSGMWDEETMCEMKISLDMCYAWSKIFDNGIRIHEFTKTPRGLIDDFWFPVTNYWSGKYYNQNCITLRINYMREQLSKLIKN